MFKYNVKMKNIIPEGMYNLQFLVFQTRFSRDRWEAVCHRTPSNYLRVGFLTKKFMGVAISFYLVLNIRHDSTILVISKFICVDTVTRIFN